jgi:hypothetical protein
MSAFGRAVRRSYKIVLPLAVGVTIVVTAFAAHIAQSVDVTDSDYLDPASAAPLGGRTLAADLAARNVSIVTETTDTDAIAAAAASATPVTLFIPSLELMRPEIAATLKVMPSGTRIVIVAPGEYRLSDTELPITATRSRWAPRSTPPDCSLPDAVSAGRATADGVEYAPTTLSARVCYGGGLVQLEDLYAPTEIVIGASDPFRNDRIGEAGNATLAVDLLSHTSTVIWLNIHSERPPPPQGKASAPETSPQTDHASGGGDRKRLADLLPPWLWAGIGLLAVAGVALAFAAGRRLGGPIAEPLPVAARINETVEGRGRLYRRTRDRKAILGILRAAAIDRIRATSGLSPTAPLTDVVTAAADRHGIPVADAARILAGAAPTDDKELLAAVAELDAITETAPTGTAGITTEGVS